MTSPPPQPPQPPQPAPKASGPASYFPSIEKKYGRPISEWLALIAARPEEPHMKTVEWLKAEYGMGHGHANALVGYTRGSRSRGGSW